MVKIFSVIVMILFGLEVTSARYVHVLVALCDNKNQGIVPVPSKIGNGQDPANNLYWGCGLGVKSFFAKQKDWKLIKLIKNPTSSIYERLIFKHKDSAVFLVADAYDGAKIKQTISDFMTFSAGNNKQTIKVDSVQILFGGNADLVCYVGHDGLMEFSLESYPKKSDNKQRQVVILSCASKQFFKTGIQNSGAYPLLWTTNLMCPEAYTLDAAIDSWIKKENPEKTREKAAMIYNQYQKCGINGARRLLVTGF